MHPSLRAAEIAALEGKVTQDFDTQQCRELQDELLSSSPQRPTTRPASPEAAPPKAKPKAPRLQPGALTCSPILQHQSPGPSQRKNAPAKLPTICEAEENSAEDGSQPTTYQDSSLRAFLHRKKQAAAQARGSQPNVPGSQPAPSTKIWGKNSQGKSRLFTQDGVELLPCQLQQKLKPATMDDSTQKSSMSCTQVNPPELYTKYNNPNQAENYAADDNDDDDHENLLPILNERPDSPPSKQRTGSTPQTYEENDTGHITLGLDSLPPSNIDEDFESQDISFAIAPNRHSHQSQLSHEPHTPAPMPNPFLQKGSVMKIGDMFGATQPSSIGRRITPSSSRPSPNIYNDFSSPVKQRRLDSSPLIHQADLLAAKTSPLQSSLRESSPIDDSITARIHGVQSFNVTHNLQQLNSHHEPRPYRSMKESQERRKRNIPRNESDTDSDSDTEPLPRNRRKGWDKEIQKELATVAVSKRAPTSSRPGSSTSVPVEVPSTRRSLQEGAAEGGDLESTDGFIADSQNPLTREESPEKLSSEAIPSRPALHSLDLALPLDGEGTLSQETQSQDDVDIAMPEPVPESTPNMLKESGHLESSLPLQNVNLNPSDLRSPSASKYQNETVPETSPSDGHLRPMGEIANISFGGREVENDMLQGLPGFTQDVEYEAVMASPQHESSKRSKLPSVPFPPISEPQDSLPPTQRSGNFEPAPISRSQSVVTAPPLLSASKLEKETEVPLNAASAATTSPQYQAVPDVDHSIASYHTIGQGVGPKLDREGSEGTEVMAGNLADVSMILGGPESEPEPVVKKKKTKGALKSKKLKGYSRSNLRASAANPRSRSATRAVPQLSTSKTSLMEAASDTSSPLSTPGSTPVLSTSMMSTPATRSSARISTSEPFISKEQQTPVPAIARRCTSRRSGVAAPVYDETSPIATPRDLISPSGKAESSREESADPLTMSPGGSLFNKMSFAVSYVEHEKQKISVIKLINKHGGTILEDGFDSLFAPMPKTGNNKPPLALSTASKGLGFTALIADEHSRKAKYMQALALGFPCISGHWILACVAKGSILPWDPYLLSAGKSLILGNAIRSRTISTYPASGALLTQTFAQRDKLLEGKSVLLVTGRGKVEEKRRAYSFLTRALGPSRIELVPDNSEARKKLLESESKGQIWDLLYVDNNEKDANAVIFGSGSSTTTKKRKRGSNAVEDAGPPPKKVRIISDETMVQSLILGQLLEE